MKTLGLSVATHGGFAQVTFDSSLPAYTGRVATSVSPSIARATVSAAKPTPRRAARRASSSRCRLVTAPRIAFGACAATSVARTGAQTSPRYGASPACSTSQIFVAPHSARRMSPSGCAESVSHTASAVPPERRLASASTSAVTFFG